MMSRGEVAMNRSGMRVLGALLLAGCGIQYTDPVYVSDMGLELSGHPTSPVIMVVWDKSGSTNQPTQAGCTGASCATRLSEMKAWANGSLPSIGASARVGLQVFPSDDTCGPSGAAQLLAKPPAAPDSSAAVLAKVPGIAGLGGTPTGQSMAFAALAMPDDNAEHFAVLLTDGVPNCNPDNPNTCVTPAACACTLNMCPSATARWGFRCELLSQWLPRRGHHQRSNRHPIQGDRRPCSEPTSPPPTR